MSRQQRNADLAVALRPPLWAHRRGDGRCHRQPRRSSRRLCHRHRRHSHSCDCVGAGGAVSMAGGVRSGSQHQRPRGLWLQVSIAPRSSQRRRWRDDGASRQGPATATPPAVVACGRRRFAAAPSAHFFRCGSGISWRRRRRWRCPPSAGLPPAVGQPGDARIRQDVCTCDSATIMWRLGYIACSPWTL